MRTLSLSVFLFSAVLFAKPGELDKSFGTAGQVKTSIGLKDRINTISISEDGAIFAGGFSFDGPAPAAIVTKYSADGVLDKNFADQGIFKRKYSKHTNDLVQSSFQPDGKLLFIGRTKDKSGAAPNNVLVVRFQKDGKPDLGFGTGGHVILPAYPKIPDYGRAAHWHDNKIYVGGSIIGGWPNHWFLASRLEPNGVLDKTFGSNGTRIVQRAYKVDTKSMDMLVDEKERMILVGRSRENTADKSFNAFMVMAFTKNGDLDTAFGDEGMRRYVISSGESMAYSVAQQKDGKLIIAGEGGEPDNASFAMLRILPNGDRDKNFGKDGVVITAVSGGDDIARRVLVQEDGKILLGGTVKVGNETDMAVIRYLPDGKLDESFGTFGLSQHSFGKSDSAYAMAIQRDGKILIGGTDDKSPPARFTLARLLP